MNPDTVSTWSPPISIAAIHEIGPLNSAAKLDRLIAIIASAGFEIRVNSNKRAAAPPYAA